MTARTTAPGKEALLDVAYDLFVQRSYAEVSMQEIAEAAGMTKGAPYYHFKNKDDLFLQVVEELVNTAMAITADEATTSKPPIEKLYAMVRHKMEFYERERDFFRIYLNEKHGLEIAPKDPHKRALREMYLQGIQTLAKVLQEGMDAGFLRPTDSRRLAFFLQEMMSTIQVHRFQGKAKTSVEEDVEQLLDLFLHGASQP
jgi:AcrR family transcriptional regulator